mmetsp:Transcript_11569/g.31522  ORF Transcript_11569/g.31522 Transcript_11569/m.31522 type:complete len:209 (-) Transcript_11569:1181-1807(-)
MTLTGSSTVLVWGTAWGCFGSKQGATSMIHLSFSSGSERTPCAKCVSSDSSTPGDSTHGSVPSTDSGGALCSSHSRTPPPDSKAALKASSKRPCAHNSSMVTFGSGGACRASGAAAGAGAEAAALCATALEAAVAAAAAFAAAAAAAVADRPAVAPSVRSELASVRRKLMRPPIWECACSSMAVALVVGEAWMVTLCLMAASICPKMT